MNLTNQIANDITKLIIEKEETLNPETRATLIGYKNDLYLTPFFEKIEGEYATIILPEDAYNTFLKDYQVLQAGVLSVYWKAKLMTDGVSSQLFSFEKLPEILREATDEIASFSAYAKPAFQGEKEREVAYQTLWLLQDSIMNLKAYPEYLNALLALLNPKEEMTLTKERRDN